MPSKKRKTSNINKQPPKNDVVSIFTFSASRYLEANAEQVIGRERETATFILGQVACVSRHVNAAVMSLRCSKRSRLW